MMRKIAKRGRKFGSDMSNGLLWATFGIAVLIGILTVYQSVRFTNSKAEAVQIMSVVADTSRSVLPEMLLDREHDGIKMVAERMGLPTTPGRGGRINLPYGAFIGSIAGRPQQFIPAGPYGGSVSLPAHLEMTIFFPNNDRASRELCHYLSFGESYAIISGPLGTDYALEHSRDEQNYLCNSPANKMIAFKYDAITFPMGS